MIDIQTTGTLPEVNSDLAPALGEIGQLMFDSVTQNFISGGRPNQWEPLKTGEAAHLIRSGKMLETLQMQTDDRSAVVSMSSRIGPIHNFGGTIKHPGSNKFQAFFFDGEMIFTHGTRPHNINIPARLFMMFQEEDRAKILEVLNTAIFTQSGEKIK